MNTQTSTIEATSRNEAMRTYSKATTRAAMVAAGFVARYIAGNHTTRNGALADCLAQFDKAHAARKVMTDARMADDMLRRCVVLVLAHEFLHENDPKILRKTLATAVVRRPRASVEGCTASACEACAMLVQS